MNSKIVFVKYMYVCGCFLCSELVNKAMIYSFDNLRLSDLCVNGVWYRYFCFAIYVFFFVDSRLPG